MVATDPLHPEAPALAEATVIYDPDCGFCRWSLALLLRADRGRRLRPVALGTEQADELLADLQPAQRAASWHLIGPDGRRHSGGAALPKVLELLPFGMDRPACSPGFPPPPTAATAGSPSTGRR